MQKSAVCLLFTLLLLGACTRRPDPATVPGKQPLVKEQPKLGPIFETGVASWYGEPFQGRRTANGEIYDMHRLTAAHQSLPFHTFVEVENIENGKKVIVRINDRGPFIKQRIIDLSQVAARRIDMVGPGTARVHLRIIKYPGAADMASPDRAIPAISFRLQVGAFAEMSNARRLRKRLVRILPHIRFDIKTASRMHRVFSQVIKLRKDAERLKTTLEEAGIQSFILEVFDERN